VFESKEALALMHWSSFYTVQLTMCSSTQTSGIL